MPYVGRVCRLYTCISGEPPPSGTLSLPCHKGMHQHTYNRLTCEFMFVKERVIQRLAAWLDAQHARN
jgi:hypothetical protein